MFMPVRTLGYCEYVGWLKFGLSSIQLALSAVMIVLVRYKLQEMATVVVHGTLVYSNTCYLSVPDDWLAACTFADVVASISMLLAFLVSMLQLYLTSLNSRLRSTRLHNTPCNKCTKRVWWAQQLLLTFDLLWWLAGSTLLQVHITRADAAGLAKGPQRAGVSACCWVSVCLLAVILAADWLPRCLVPGAVPAGIPLGYPTSFSSPPPAASALPSQHQQQHQQQQHQQQHQQQQQQPVQLQQAQQLPLAAPAAVVMGIPVVPGVVRQQQAPRAHSAPPATTSPMAAGVGPAQLQMTLLELGRLPGNHLAAPQGPRGLPVPATWVIGQRAMPGQAFTASSRATSAGAVMRVAVVEAPEPLAVRRQQLQHSSQQQSSQQLQQLQSPSQQLQSTASARSV